MNVADLMIGDWIKTANGYERVATLHSPGGQQRETFLFNPIPLTPEIMTLNGFTEETHGWNALNCFKRSIGGWDRTFIKWYPASKDLDICYGANRRFQVKVDSVHQLQHVFKMLDLRIDLTV